ncbi:unnamed protein product [Polarella glacialis]|uniref:Uncharacterized protein n=1 Tax=Polarella glacialis TaxID=89957 RepID=A0A813GXA3_POLGL|nr:unnamed protein product [Polarella glacialis]
MPRELLYCCCCFVVVVVFVVVIVVVAVVVAVVIVVVAVVSDKAVHYLCSSSPSVLTSVSPDDEVALSCQRGCGSCLKKPQQLLVLLIQILFQGNLTSSRQEPWGGR